MRENDKNKDTNQDSRPNRQEKCFACERTGNRIQFKQFRKLTL